MKTSEMINEISAALSKAQAKIEDAVKDGKNPHFKSQYATLGAVLEAVRKPLAENGLAVAQAVEMTEAGTSLLVTRLCHSSGQWLESAMPLMMQRQDMQGLGSAITYARRYSLSALVGVTQTDDDAESTINRNMSPANIVTNSAGTPPVEEMPPWMSEADTPTTGDIGPTMPQERQRPVTPTYLSEKQIKRLYAITRNSKWTEAQAKAYIKSLGFESSYDLTRESYDSVCQYIEAHPASQP